MSRKDATADRRARAAQIQAEAKRRQRRTSIALGSIVGVIVLVLALLVAKAISGDRKSATPTGKLSAATAKAVTSVPASVYDAIGLGTSQTGPVPVKGEAQTADGKPRVLYVGAEYCPFCAAERWAMVAALSRFGTFTGLGSTTSSATDVYPSTPTLSFHGAGYTSKYLSFKGYETETNQPQGQSYAPLDTPSAADEKLLEKYDAPPYVSAQSKGSIPFVLFGGKYVISGASYNPQVLAGMTHAQIAKAMSDKNSDVAKGIDGTANQITAALCKLTDGQPSTVCSSAGVTAGAAKIG